LCKTNPGCPARQEIDAGGRSRKAPWRTIMKNEPNFRQCRAGRGQRDVGREANAQNKPNLPGRAWGRGPWDVVRTKPIPGGATERVSALWERSYGE
jgi:hypothetical protein